MEGEGCASHRVVSAEQKGTFSAMGLKLHWGQESGAHRRVQVRERGWHITSIPSHQGTATFKFGTDQKYLRNVVVVYAVMDTEGKLHSLAIKQTPDSRFTAPILAALNHWTFRSGTIQRPTRRSEGSNRDPSAAIPSMNRTVSASGDFHFCHTQRLFVGMFSA